MKSDSPFTIYGRPGCGYCYRAIQLLQANNLEFEYIDIYKQGLTKQDVSKRINQPVFTVPQIMHGDHYVGGCNELFRYLMD